ncbi:zinc-dependent metalloprotease [Paraneptunicella aestuarii]|uniref:zinc-dependent metalloprotease n=1 Tax=Paraneptunicella aestuarii TaxID=2831148 RepID=UPI001E33FC59|nr:zinc-dependent metalloprotease [Paraneptunicella aestuarii]UAA37870.1 zinc-dependent metalloprotease [Paraneptunicella aestuarii]
MRFLVGFILVLLTTTSNVALAEENKTLSPTEYVQNLESKQGFYTFYYRPSDGKLYLLVNKSQLDDEFLFQSSLPYGMGSNDIGLDRGQLGDTRLVKFERFGKRVLLKQLNTGYRASTDNPAEKQSVNEAFASSVIAGLEIVAESDEQLLVDYTDFLLSDIHRIGETLKTQKQGSYKIDATRSGVHAENSKAFPDNIELESLVTFVGSDAGDFVKQVTPSYESITVHLHHSLIRLPDNNYKTRVFHPMSGYWSISHKDYGTAIDEPLVQRVIPRHRLEKKNPTAKVSEAVEPIVYYLDPGVPEPIRSALKDGAMWWDQAFAAIGYKNAFQVKDLPQGADPMDVRYNTIQWVHRATRGWSYGYSVIDPRTGEILKGHVTLGSLRVRQDLLIALGLTSPFDDKQTNEKQADITPQKDMALARIRQLSAHEVGHTLGIAHNFAASENGRASVMDYPHPLLTLKRGKIDLSNAYDTGIGEWDKHVIAYGYQNYANAEQEQKGLMNIIHNAQKQGLDFMSDPDARGIASANPQGHLWDNGNNPINELKNVMAVRKTALENFGLNSIAPGSPLSQLEENLVPIYLLHRFQLEAVVRQIGGTAYSYETKEAGKKPQGISPVTAKHQEQALKSLLIALETENLKLSDELLSLITPQAYGYERTREAFKGQTSQVFDSLGAAESLSAHIVKMILHPARLNRLSLQNQKDFNISTLIDELLKATFSASKPESDIQNRVNHVVVNALVELLEKPELGIESKAVIHDALTALVENAGDDDKASKSQKLIISWLEHYLSEGEWKGKLNTAPLPPGSPI